MPTLLDTHAWVWWVTEDRRLSKRARSAIRNALAAHDLWISLISVWELAKRVEKKQLGLDRPVDDWLDDAVAPQGLGV
jgi:PIN domain nuclease of toxin-antitoxin system